MTFDELSTLKQPSASLRTALDKISAALGSVGDAGQQARSVVDELRVSLRAAAAQSVKSARSLAKFDEINRLSAPAEDKTAAEKQKKAAEAAAKAEKAARSTTGTAARRSGTAGSDLSGLTAVWRRNFFIRCGKQTVRPGSLSPTGKRQRHRMCRDRRFMRSGFGAAIRQKFWIHRPERSCPVRLLSEMAGR